MKKNSVSYSARVSEIGDASSGLSIDEALVASVVHDDDNPQFVTVEISSGWSKNKRYWPATILDKIATQVNERKPVGYQGHVKEEDMGSVLPDPQTIWLKAITTTTDAGKKLLIKGYNLPGSKVRGWVKSKAINSVSVFGNADLEQIKGGWEVKDINLESIDWSRKAGEGMATKLVSVTSEMEGDEMEPQEIGKLTLAELKEHNPSLVALIAKDVSTESDKTISEMEDSVKALEADKDVLGKIRTLLGIDENADPLKALGELNEKVSAIVKSGAKDIIEGVLAKRFKDDRSKRLVTLAIGEMDQGDKDEEAFSKEIDDKVTSILKDDEHIRASVSEIDNSGNGTSNNDASKDDGSKSGGLSLSTRLTSGKKNVEKENDYLVEEVISV